MANIRDLEDLNTWLIRNGVDISKWGTGNTKSLADLWNELAVGDIEVRDDPPARVVHVVQIVIRKGNYVLKELEQELGNGERRLRNRLPSEKMKLDENCIDAALRCLKEELDVDSQDVSFVTPTCEQVEQVTADSPSYPGLLTKYTFHTIEAKVRGIPNTDFWRDNAAFGAGDPVKRHYWAWRTVATAIACDD